MDNIDNMDKLEDTIADDPSGSEQPRVTKHLKRDDVPEIGRLTKKYDRMFYRATHHHVLSSLNMNHCINIDSDEDIDSCSFPQTFAFFTPFPYRATLLLPILNALHTPQEVLLGEDPANQAVRKKQEMKLSLLRKLGPRRKNTTKKETVVSETRKALQKMDATNRDKVTVPNLVAQMASIIQEDTDPNFDGDFNWYYSGGNLSHLNVGEEHVLLAARGEQCSSLRAIPIERSQHSTIGFESQMSESASYDMAADGTIFQIVTRTHKDKGLVGVRQRMKCSILEYNQDSECSLNEIHSFVAKHAPYTSIALSPWSPDRYCVSTVQGLLRVWDINTNTNLLIYKRDKKLHKWSGLHYSKNSSQTVFYSKEKFIEMIDFRDPSCTQEMFRIDGADFEPCEVISMSESSNASCTLQYIATSHHLLTMDIRKPGKYLQKWTHLLVGPPQYIKLSQETTERELVCLGSTEESHIISVVNEWPGEDMIKFPVSRSQPLCIGSLDTTLTKAKLQGLCLKPSIQSRFKLNLTGITCLSDTIFCATAAGDVFSQTISPRFAENNEEEEEELMKTCLSEWQVQVDKEDLNSEVPPLYLSEHLNVTNVLKTVFDESTEEKVEKKSVAPIPTKWELPHIDLFCSRDIFGSKILSAWNITDVVSWESERAKAYGEDSKIPYIPEQKIERVHEWLSSNVLDQSQIPQSQDTSNLNFPQSSQMSQIYEASQSQMSTSRLLQSNTQDMTLTQQSEVAYTESQDVGMLKRKSVSKYSKMRKRRTDGF